LEDIMALHLRAVLKLSSSLRWTTGLLLAAPLFAVPVFANPLGGAVTSGSASVSSPSAHQTDVDQKSEDVVIDWSNFNISVGQTTQFVQPNAQAIAVNRIGGSAPSQIMGNLDANGRLILINGNGMVFGKGSQVNVGALVATTAGGSDSDVLAGKFTQAGNRNASIVNRGAITASQGGLVALVAPHVSNSGTVSAKLGTVALGGANQFTVDFAGDGLVSFAAQGTGPASVTNTGRLAGANVSLTARAAEGVATSVVNMSGTIVAQGAHDQGGTIVLDAGDGGDVSVSNANLNASGTNGGGRITIGGWNQNAVTVDKASVLNASATATGNGGAISVIGSSTGFEGRALAQGGRLSGNGGTIETSGYSLAFDGARVIASSAHGADGQWLLDPYNLKVNHAAAVTIDSTLNSGTSVTLQTTATGTSGPGNPNPSGKGDIFIERRIAWSTSATLTLSAYRNVYINADITASGGGSLSLTTGTGTAGDYTISEGNHISFTGGSSSGSTLSINGRSYTLLYDMDDVQNINNDLSGDYALAEPLNASSTTNWVPLGADASGIVTKGTGFTGTFEGLGNTISRLTVNTGQGYTGFFGYSTGTIENIGLIRESVKGSGGLGGLVGTNVGTISSSYVTGSIGTHKATGDGGLVAFNGGTVTDSYFVGIVEGSDMVGGLVGWNNAGSISNSYSTGLVSGRVGSAVGGLVGWNYATISNSYATGSVNSSGNDSVAGGLVGTDYSGSIVKDSYSTDAINDDSSSDLGGLVGLAEAHDTIKNSYWDTTTSGITNLSQGIGNIANALGITGLTTAQIQSGLPAGFDPAIWGESATINGGLPYLLALPPS
jgi:filamentous hemagglutinin family protein